MFDPNNLRFFIAVPLGNGQECSDPFNRPDLFHIVDVDYETAERIGDSPFSSAASKETDKYPIDLFEDPFFDPSDVDALLKCLEKWRKSLQEEDKDAFLVVESLLLEAKERGVGIYFKF